MLITLSLMIVALIIAEVISDGQVVALTDAVSGNQAKLSRMQQQQEILRQMVQKLAIASQTDPDVAELLKNHGIKVTLNNQPETPSTPVTPATPPTHAAPAPAVPPVAQ